MKQPLVIITGATAVGKTELSLRLAKQINGRIISADSMQVYKGFDIGTAKITKEEMQGIRHDLIDILNPDEEFNVYEFRRRAEQSIQDAYKEGFIPVIVGGTGFYIQSVLYAVDFTEEPADKTLRNELEEFARSNGAQALHQLLAEKDPEAAEQIHANNIKRVIRAIEFYEETGTRISEHNQLQRQKISPYNFAYFVLNRERSSIYARINKRVEIMFQQGLVEEVKELLDKGVSPDCLAMQGLGYKEIVEYLNGNLSLDETKELLKLRTRHFAKRQLTWFRREKDPIWINYEDYDGTSQMLSCMMNLLKEKEIV